MTEEELKEAEHFASLLLTDDELDDILELPTGTVARVIHDKQDALGRAIRTGRLLTKCELHTSILTTARRHSTPAQQMAAELLKKIDLQ
jgi:hypothetical protein